VAVNDLSRDEARERARLLAVSSYDVALDLTDGAGRPGEETFRSETTVRFTCSEPGAATHLDITAPRVLEVVLNGEAVPVEHDGHRLALSGLAAENELRVVADCAYMRTGEGLHRFVDPVDGSVYLYTQFETFDAHRMYACFDQPDLKSAFRFTVTAPADWKVVSNAPAEATDAAAGGAVATRFAETAVMSTYITALVAGPYHEVRDTHTSGGLDLDLGLFCRASLAEHLDPEALFEVTKQGFDFYHRVFEVPYPFGKYDQLFVPEFNAGAMENAGAVTYLEDYVFRSRVTDAAYERRAETVLHEMAHMWFGDLVTMRWWDDLWLNESFATYMSVLCQAEATRWTEAWTTFANVEKTWALRQDQLSSTHPVAADIPDIEAVKVNFDGITYAKGASLLKQLVAWVGRDAFFAGLRRYFDRHAFGNTELRDLLTVLEDASGRELGSWTKEWLQTAGVNTLRPELETDADGVLTSVAVVQTATEEHPTVRRHRVAVGCYDWEGDRLVRTRREELDVEGERTEVPALVGERRPALLLVNDDDLTFAKLRLDDASLGTVTESIGALAESLPRALCWAAAWDMTRDGEMSTGDYLRLVLGGISSETDIGVVQALLRQVVMAVRLYGDPAARSERLATVAAAALDAASSAEPGSDHQLAWVRALAGVASEPEHLRLLAGLLSGEEVLPGLAVDSDLRWALLTRLVATGAADDAEVDAELERDRTAAGQRHATAARAARPTAEAKAVAWRLATQDSGLANAVQAAVIGGFVQPDQLHLLEPYAQEYFEVVEDVWASRTSEMAQQVAVGLYPALLATPETLAATDAWLARTSAPSALQRLVREGRDGVVRALAAQERDRAASAAG
jgi:aminopeptidase N